MVTLLYIGVVFAAAMAAITFYAVASAKDGFEDELGFHPVSPTAINKLDGLSDGLSENVDQGKRHRPVQWPLFGE